MFGLRLDPSRRQRAVVQLSALLAELAASPLARPASPFKDLPRRRGVTWLEPTVAVELQYNDMTGGRLRARVLRGFARHA